MQTVWIVDDDNALLHSLELAFQHTYKTRTFSDSISCLEAFLETERSWPHIIITDYELPVLNGLDLLRLIQPNKRKIRAYLFSAGLTGEVIEKAKKLGVNGWMEKPFDLIKLKEMIED